MSDFQQSYIGAKIVYGDEHYAIICNVDNVYQDDGGEDDFYLLLSDENGDFFGEIHIDDYLDGFAPETKYDNSYIIWIDENNQIDRDYFELARSIDKNDADEFQKIEIQKIQKTYKKALQEKAF